MLNLLRRIARARSESPAGPVRFDPYHDQWTVEGYENVRAVLGDWRSFSSCPLAGIDFVLLGADPPAHARVRRAVARSFGAEALESVVRSMEELATRLVGVRFDVVADYAVPLTRRVAAVLVGLTDAQVGDVIAAVQDARARGGMLVAPDPVPGPVRRAAIRKALSDEAGELLDERALDSLVTLLCLAAFETSVRAISRAALSLFEDPALRERVAGDPASLARFVEEVLRLYPPTPGLLRTTAAPVEIGGAHIPADAAVLLQVAAANRDPAQFEAPDALRLDRAKNAHLAFGGGVHQCLGAGLARRVIPAALSALLGHRPKLRPLEPLGAIRFTGPEACAVPERLIVGHG